VRHAALLARALTMQLRSLRFPRTFIKAMGQIKQCAAVVNKSLGVLDPKLADAIVEAAQKARWRRRGALTRLAGEACVRCVAARCHRASAAAPLPARL
jgi:hypothetical protein